MDIQYKADKLLAARTAEFNEAQNRLEMCIEDLQGKGLVQQRKQEELQAVCDEKDEEIEQARRTQELTQFNSKVLEAKAVSLTQELAEVKTNYERIQRLYDSLQPELAKLKNDVKDLSGVKEEQEKRILQLEKIEQKYFKIKHTLRKEVEVQTDEVRGLKSDFTRKKLAVAEGRFEACHAFRMLIL